MFLPFQIKYRKYPKFLDRIKNRYIEYNDTVEEIGDIASFALSLPNVNEIHLLPYHRMGRDKYEGLGREYLMGDVPSPTAEHMQILLEVCRNKGLTAHLGG